MDFMMFYMITIISSFLMEMGMGFNFYKRISIKGYKINVEKEMPDIKSNEQQTNDDNAILRRLIKVTPLINMLNCIYEAKIYSDNFENLLEYMIQMNYVVKMNEKELKEFDKNKTGINAWLMHSKEKSKKENIKKIIIKENNKEIYYNFDKLSVEKSKEGQYYLKIENLEIIKSSTLLKEEENKAIVMASLTKFIEELVKNTTIKELLKKDINNILINGIYFDEIDVENNKKQENQKDNTTSFSAVAKIKNYDISQEEEKNDVKKLVLKKKNNNKQK